MKLPLSTIYVGKRRRTNYGTDEMAALQKDMQDSGQITAITVRPPNDDDREEEDYNGEPWVLVAGGRRLVAAAMLGWQEIEAYGREEMDQIKHRRLELAENIHRKEMSWQEINDATMEIVALERLLNPKITDGEIAQKIGIAQSTLSREIATAKVIEVNPGLARANSRHSALQAGKLLEEHRVRVQRVTGQPSTSTPESTDIVPIDRRIRTADALEYVTTLESNSIDLFLLDGPYGYNYWKSGHKTSTDEGVGLSAYDDDPERTGDLYRALLPLLMGPIRETGWLVFFCGKETYDFIEELCQDLCARHGAYRNRQFTSICDAAHLGSGNSGDCRFLYPEPFPWIWYRPNSRNQPRHPNLHAKSFTELILVVNAGKGRIVKTPRSNILIHDAEYGAERVHANQKPPSLYKDLIESFTFVGDTVCDTFFGSGNSLGAAASTGRIPWGCDKNPEMLPFALAKCRSQMPISKAMIEASWKRYQDGLSMELPSETTLLESELSSETADPGPSAMTPSARSVTSFVADEAFQIGKGEWLCYVLYDGHNMAQATSHNEASAYTKAEKKAEILNNLSALGMIDPCCCTVDEAQEALREWEKGLLENPA